MTCNCGFNVRFIAVHVCVLLHTCIWEKWNVTGRHDRIESRVIYCENLPDLVNYWHDLQNIIFLYYPNGGGGGEGAEEGVVSQCAYSAECYTLLSPVKCLVTNFVIIIYTCWARRLFDGSYRAGLTFLGASGCCVSVSTVTCWRI